MDPTLLAQIAELLGREEAEVTALSLEELDEALRTAFEEGAAADGADLARLEAIADARDGVVAAIADADAAEAERSDRIEALRSRMAPVVAETEPGEGDDDETTEDGDGENTETEPTEGVEAPAEPVAAPAAPASLDPIPEVVAEAPVAVAADAAPAVAPVTPAPAPRVTMARRRPATHAPVETGNDAVVTITAAADVPGFGAGSRIPTLHDLGHAFAERVDGLVGARGITGKVPVARMHLPYPEERHLDGAETERNTRRIEAVISPEAITAAGGLCAPVAVRYELENVSVDDRPIRDSLPRFNADRGGITFVRPPLLSGITSGVAVVTEEQDASSTTKPCLAITCGSTVEVDVSAVYRCLQVGNFNRRFFPEQFATFWALAGAAHARIAEGQLLDGIGSVATQVSDGQNLGAARDLLEAGVRAAAQMRNRHRMRRGAPIRWLLPDWVRDMIRADLIREHAGGPESLVRTDAQIEAYFRAANINTTWYLDTETGEGQVYGAQGNQALLGWNLSPVTYMFPEGSFIFLDGGTLDLGIEIRDTTMNEGNNVRAFTETFENIAFIGVEALEITHNLCVSGAGSLDIAVTCPENS